MLLNGSEKCKYHGKTFATETQRHGDKHYRELDPISYVIFSP